MPYTDPKTGILYPSFEYYQQKVNPETGVSLVEEKRKAQAETEKTGTIPEKTNDTLIDQTTGTFKVEELSGDQADITSAKSRTAFYDEMLKQQQAQLDKLEKEREERQKAFDEENKKKQSTIDKLLGREEKREAEFEKRGVKPDEFFAQQQATIAEIRASMEEYDALVTRKDTEIARIESMNMIESAQNTEKIKAEKKYNIELSQKAANIKTKMAIQEMENNNFERARSFVDEAVEDYTFDLKLELAEYDQFVETNQAAIDELDDDYKDILNQTYATMEAKFNEEDAKAKDIRDMILKYPTANIDFTDTIEEATRKASGVTQTAETKAPTTRMINNVLHEYDPDTGTWSPAEITTTTDIPAPPDYVESFQSYKTAGWSREQVENSWIAQYNQGKTANMQIKDKKELYKQFPEIKSSLDEVFKQKKPSTPSFGETLKQIPSVIKDWWQGLWK